ncbi:MAG: low molecular weight protein arginine phosphatase [Candidatus Sumerlaeia bacterium]|nr:low molecular weight protein arginine phosphatase [Candidatus Sumerlaeia bacterium]
MASLLLSKKKKKKIVVFLCTGNTCRGPMAQGYMKAAMDEREITGIEVRTAGVMTIPGLIPTPEATLVLKNAGIDIRAHRSSPLTPELIAKADLILGMTPFHVQFALRMSDDARGKTYLLKEYAESDVKMFQISDPMGMTLEVYKRVYREMKLAIDRILDNKEFFTGQTPEKPAAEPEPPKVEKKKPARRKAPAKASKKKTTASSSS